jgi:hypothetical protein
MGIHFVSKAEKPFLQTSLKKLFFGKIKPTNISVGPKMVHNIQFVPFH